jgi:hypothetical protein
MNHQQSSDLAIEVPRIARDVRWLKAFAFMATLGIIVIALTAATSRRSATELSVERINIVDANGTTRLVIANAGRFPLPKLNGKEYPRAHAPAGMIFYDSKGNEVGGLAVSDQQAGKLSALAFDYPNYDALGLTTQVSADGKSATAGLRINSRPPADFDIDQASKVVQRRIAILNENENAVISLSDPKGRERIRLQVNDKGEPRIEMLDATGKVIFSAPEQK